MQEKESIICVVRTKNSVTWAIKDSYSRVCMQEYTCIILENTFVSLRSVIFVIMFKHVYYMVLLYIYIHAYVYTAHAEPLHVGHP